MYTLTPKLKMIGIGIDLVRIQRMADIINRSGEVFIKKLFTDREIELSSQENRIVYFAMRFAAKEAILKALSIGWTDGVKGTDIEIKRGKLGEPLVTLSGKVGEVAARKGVKRVFLSMSYDSEYAIAVAVLE